MNDEIGMGKILLKVNRWFKKNKTLSREQYIKFAKEQGFLDD